MPCAYLDGDRWGELRSDETAMPVVRESADCVQEAWPISSPVLPDETYYNLHGHGHGHGHMVAAHCMRPQESTGEAHCKSKERLSGESERRGPGWTCPRVLSTLYRGVSHPEVYEGGG